MESIICVCGVFSVLLNYGVVHSFNLDTKVPIVKEGIQNSYFGFSVAQHQIYNDILGQSSHVLLVGAPLDNVTDPSALQKVRELKSPGVIYSCPFTSNTNDCQWVKLDSEAPTARNIKDGQWLGVSLASQGTTEGQAVACAHKNTDGDDNHRWGLGVCITMTNTLDPDSYLEACGGLPKDKVHEDYGMCQAGTSVSLYEDGDVLLGAPGARSWGGVAFKNSIALSLESDQTWYRSPADPVDKDNPGPEPAVKFYSYLGMASKIAKVIGDQKTYISGAPRSQDVGQVLMFTQGENGRLDIRPEHYLTGEQFGSWFGCDFTVADLNNDSKLDLIVGAPFYSEEGIGGAIYVYMNGPKGITSSTEPMKIKSRKMPATECMRLKCENSRFGFSIESVGDVDKDGYGDLAVGAPFEGDGVVYIFRGSKDGLLKEPSQRIEAADLQSARPLTTFGYSLSGGNDMDNNEYPDLVVGSFESQKAVVLRARPVINIFPILQFIPDVIKTSTTQCPKTGHPENCFEVRACFKFTAEPKREFTGPLDITYKLEADKFTGKLKSRVYFKGTDPKQDVMERNIAIVPQDSADPLSCILHVVYIYDSNKDFLNPIPFRLTYKLTGVQTPVMNPGDAVPPFNTYPILNEKSAELKKSIHFENNCGADNKCQSNLVVTGEFPDLGRDEDSKLPLLKASDTGKGKILRMNIGVRNQGEDAHEATLYVILPEELTYVGTGEPGERELYSCTPQGRLVTCSVGNPLKENHSARIIVRLDTSQVPPTKPYLNITIKANTTSDETIPEDDSMRLTMRVVVETDLALFGRSEPEEVFYGGEVRGESEMKYEKDIGYQVIHRYEVTNEGRGKVENTKVTIHWPYEVANPGYDQGKHLLYLMEEPLVDPATAGSCTVPENYINVLKLRVDRTLKLKPSLKQPPAYNVTEGVGETREKRVKRQSVVQHDNIRDSSGRILKVVTLDCDKTSAKCFKIECTINDAVVIKLRARLWNSTFLQDYKNVDSVHVYSKATLKIDPALNIKETNLTNNLAKARTVAIPDIQVQEGAGVPLWAIIVAAVAGLLLLILIIIIMWKCGFFQRRRHPDDMKKHKGTLQKQNFDDDKYN